MSLLTHIEPETLTDETADTRALLPALMDSFFVTTPPQELDALLDDYQVQRERIERAAAFFSGDMQGVISYFIDGNRAGDGSRYSSITAQKLFELDGAIAALDAAFWQRALAKTDIYQAMPQKRRDDWNTAIREHKTLPFSADTLFPTLRDLMQARVRFFAERVDGIFRALSGEHVTNSPAAFRKRMIVNHLVTSYGTTNTDRVGFINDLRCVIAKFMGRDEPQWNASDALVDRARKEKRGEWISVDGGALRLRAYKCGTAHIEVHPDMAWRLNGILAHLYPDAIPASFRQPSRKPVREFVMMQRPLPFAVLNALDAMEKVKEPYEVGFRRYYREVARTLRFRYSTGNDKGIADEIDRILRMIGGVKMPAGHYAFDYEPGDVIAEIICSGCIPDQVAHQFYASSPRIAADATALLAAEPGMKTLEPNAGQGDLAELLPREDVQCVEIAPLHCAILKAKGFAVIEADFLEWAGTAPTFPRVLMNPPFSSGRWQAHLQAAASLVSPGGRLVAVLPASARGKELLPGFVGTWSAIYANEFAGTGAAVAIYTADKPAL